MILYVRHVVFFHVKFHRHEIHEMLAWRKEALVENDSDERPQ